MEGNLSLCNYFGLIALLFTIVVMFTLCADEVCPAYLGKAHRLHWGM